jgi:threonine/homoserine/homoserine lactone efflux protein
MSGIMPYLSQGLGYGFLAGVTIGPFLGYIINIVLTRGWRRTLPLVTIPPLIDTPIIILMVFLLGALPEFVLDIMSVVGGSFVLWLGWSTWKDNQDARDARQEMKRKSIHDTGRFTMPESLGASMGLIYLRGMLVNALNPAPYLFWSTVSGPILLDGIRDGGAPYAAIFLISYYSMFLSLIAVLMIVVERIGNLDERMNRYLLPVTIVLMIVLGLGLVGAGLFDLTQTLAS